VPCDLLHYGRTYKSFHLKKVQELGTGGIVPTTLKLRVGEEMFAVLYKPIDNLVSNTIYPMITNNMLSFDLIIGIDHGQGSMQCAVKLIL